MFVAAAGQWVMGQWQWRYPKGNYANQEVSMEVSNLPDILQDIMPNLEAQNRWLWFLEPHKCYTIKSCYQQVQQLQSSAIIDTITYFL